MMSYLSIHPRGAGGGGRASMAWRRSALGGGACIGPRRGPDFGTSCPSTTGFVRRFPSRPARAPAQRVGPVAGRLALFGHQLPIDDRVRAPLPFESRAPDSRVDGVRCSLLGVEEADVAPVAVRVAVFRLPPSRPLVPTHAPELGRRLRRRARWVRRDDCGAVKLRPSRGFRHERARRACLES